MLLGQTKPAGPKPNGSSRTGQAERVKPNGSSRTGPCPILEYSYHDVLFRLSRLATVVECHLPPLAEGLPMRVLVHSAAIQDREMAATTRRNGRPTASSDGRSTG
jgi:hypothetical protein